jgi:hypothetical protein
MLLSTIPIRIAENWRIAREMTEADLMATDVGAFLATL